MGFRSFAAALMLMIAVVPRADAQNDRYGVHTYYLSPYLAEKSRELGMGYVRIQIDWDTLQPEGPDEWNDAQLVNWLDNARANRLKLFATLANTPLWAGPCQHCMPDSGGSWENFVYRVMAEARARYPDVDVVYGIWNEPNLTGPRGFFMGTDADYATLFSLADAARRAANPAARLGGPELADGGTDPYGYLDAVMKDMQPYLRRSDVITVHCVANLVRTDGSNRPAFADYRNRATGRFSPVARATLRTANGRYLSDFEMLDLVDLNGGALRDGDAIALQTPRGLYLQADQGGGGALLGVGFAPGAWETFTLIDRDRPDDIVTDGDHIALRSSSGLYVSVEPGRAGAVNANRESIGSWETFQLVLSSH